MRFQATEEGKKAKGIHLDWHFKVNSRVADSMKSAINRSWYIDERVSDVLLSLKHNTNSTTGMDQLS
jgi:hypothetical protein